MELYGLINEITKHEKTLEKAKLVFKALRKGVVKTPINSATALNFNYELKVAGRKEQIPVYKDKIVHVGNGNVKHVPKIIVDNLEFWFTKEEMGISAQYWGHFKRMGKSYQTPFAELVRKALIKKFESFGVELEISMVYYVGIDPTDEKLIYNPNTQPR